MSSVPPLHAELRDYAGRLITFDELSKKAQKALKYRAFDRAMDLLVIHANEIRNDIILSMRNSPQTGKAYFRGRTKKGKPKFHRASSPGFPPRPDSGDLLRSIITDVRFTEVEVGSIITNPAYPKFLEEGTSRMEARPWLEPAKKRGEPRLRMAMRRLLRDIATEIIK